MSGERTWRERHPFLYGMSQTFGIFAYREKIQPPNEPPAAVRHSFERVEAAIAEAERRQANDAADASLLPSQSPQEARNV